nr:gonadoliberin III [Azoarcus taiwanensis]
MSRKPFYIVVALLMFIGIGLSVHRHIQYEVPFTPGEQRAVWEVEAQVRLEAGGGPVIVELAVPISQQG